jgi:hypothetical protein
MKITRRQLRQIIEGSIKKKGDYTIPVEDPLPDPLKDLDYDEDQKDKIKTLALSGDQETRVYSDFLADIGDYESIDRFGADTFSKHVQGVDLGTDMLSDLDIDSAISTACSHWIYQEKDYLSYVDHIDKDSFREYVDFMLQGYDHDSIIEEIKIYTTEVLDKRIESLIKISNSAAPVPSVDEKVAYYENAKKLFSPDHDNPIVADHVIDKFTSVLYPFYLDWKKYYMSGERDIPEEELTPELKAKFADIKEGKITRKQLRQLIDEVLIESSHKYMVTPDGETYTMDQARIAKLTGRTLDAMATGKNPKLDVLRKADPNYARELATTLEYQPDLTQIEIGAQNLPDRDFSKPDTQLQDYSLIKSIEIIKHLKSECQRRYYNCTINDEREWDPEDPFIALGIDGTGYDPNVNFSVHFGGVDGMDITIYDNLQRGVFEPYDYYGIYPDPQNPADFKNAALQILDIVEKAAHFEFKSDQD